MFAKMPDNFIGEELYGGAILHSGATVPAWLHRPRYYYVGYLQCVIDESTTIDGWLLGFVQTLTGRLYIHVYGVRKGMLTEG